jgi:hypothetical protein
MDIDPALRNSLFVIGGVILTVLGGLVSSFIMSRTSLPAMAKNAYDLANAATKDLKEFKDRRDKEQEEDRLERERERDLFHAEIEKLKAMLTGRVRFTGYYSQSSLARDGYAPIEGGRVELVRVDAPGVMFEQEIVE